MTETRRTDDTQRSVGRERAARALLWSERALVAVGLTCLILWASACAQRSLYQASEKIRFEDSIRQALTAEGHDQSEWSVQRISAYLDSRDLRVDSVEALGRLTIPAAGVSVMVLDGTDEAVLDRAVGRIPGTAQIGEEGNLGIAGHRDGFFRGLRHLEAGDELELATPDGVTRYRVSTLRVVEPEAVEVLDPTPTATITLVTCFPFYYVGSAPQRFIVHGEQVAFDPWTSATAASYLHAANASPRRAP